MNTYPLLDTIDHPAQLRELDRKQLQQLAEELAATQQERDVLQQRLEQASLRINALLEQLPQSSTELAS